MAQVAGPAFPMPSASDILMDPLRAQPGTHMPRWCVEAQVARAWDAAVWEAVDVADVNRGLASMVLADGACGPAFLVFGGGSAALREDAGRASVKATAAVEEAAMLRVAMAAEAAEPRAGGSCGGPPDRRDVAVQCPAPSRLTCEVPELVRFAQRGEAEEVQRLLAEGEDPNRLDDLGLTALHGAAKKGHGRIVSLLLEHRADVDACAFGWCGETPLHYACKYGHAAVARQLLERGADPLAASREGKTPLQHAHEQRRPGVLALLAAAGARRGPSGVH
mmetsp:Transcript_103960/g.289678  ORF Transcript_103960/g.289678 Transcript_103960/m.289678 type:complete len:278 (-) Transcript_103960:495-1328(-)|eukprot:CAMPEP_0179124528 /NCGR_PEP_ID=MMETSP0796-20121207/58853_1 /TAXON_ID=73915 /ORGANISM="Pyrodinium bahamense, Strain pbaha01" /LENGTH=277 /DNA_ID=CAMNT_0020823195 /DNA_START=53 /DNA_END=886 /DNA_ORIENTATION=+